MSQAPEGCKGIELHFQTGNTPIVKVDGIYAKLECTNPTGSIKDRIAKYIIDESEKLGVLKPGMKIVEATSGNTGIAFSNYAKLKGYEITIVMPENMSDERKSIMKALGANLIYCSAGNFMEAASIRNEIAQDTAYFNPAQFSNPLNVECHFKNTGQELIAQVKDFGDGIDAFVAGVGTGGTLIGVAQALKQVNPDTFIAAVEPEESPVMSGGKAGIHGIQGIGDGFVPDIAKGERNGLHEAIDEVIRVSTKDAVEASHYLAEKGLCVGISSGANYLAAKGLAEKYGAVATVFSDGYVKYVSHGLMTHEKCEHQGVCYSPDCR
jgi:cysteine synthase A